VERIVVNERKRVKSVSESERIQCGFGFAMIIVVVELGKVSQLRVSTLNHTAQNLFFDKTAQIFFFHNLYFFLLG
jgi:hypothetical protein